ncbi:MAG: rod shape-determining protein MreC [Massiliimalia sp.]|jgi:rod shape-determining protein MreC
MEKFFKSRRFKILITVIAVLFGFMLYTASTDGLASMPEKLLSYVTVPIQKVTAAISNGTTNFFGKYLEVDETLKENEELKEERDEYRQKLVDYEDIVRENEELKKYLDIKDKNPDYEFASAMVISRDPDNKYETFKIDVGTMDGVNKYDPVITTVENDGETLGSLVGIVEAVGPRTASVRTILSSQIDGVGAYDISMPEQLGLVVGDIALAESGLCKMEYLTEPVQVGDLIATSGSSGIYPKGIVIGRVRSVKMQTYGHSYYAEITPATDFQKLQNVMVIKGFYGKGIDQTQDVPETTE